MDLSFQSPFIECFRRGEVPRDLRLLAARGMVAPGVHEQVALLVLLARDADPEVAHVAGATIASLSSKALPGYLARADVPADLRAFFAARGVTPGPAAHEGDAPLLEADDPLPEVSLEEPLAEASGPDAAETGPGAGELPKRVPIAMLPVIDRIKLAMRGTREQRIVLIRDPNRLVSAAVLSSPKLTESEVEAIARMANVSDEVLRVVGSNRSWTKRYAVIAALARNPKTPPSTSMPLVARLNERDLKMIGMDRNVPEGLRVAAQKFLKTNTERRRSRFAEHGESPTRPGARATAGGGSCAAAARASGRPSRPRQAPPSPPRLRPSARRPTRSASATARPCTRPPSRAPPRCPSPSAGRSRARGRA